MTARVLLYSREGCHLCDEARDTVAQVCADAGADWSEVDVDQDGELRERYGEDVPVVTVDGAVIGFWRINPELLRSALS